MKYLLLITLAFYFYGCTPIMKVLYDIKQPEHETTADVLRAAAKYEFPLTYICRPDMITWVQIIELHLGVPEVQIFNRDGYLVPYKNNPALCNAKAFAMLDSLCITSIFPDTSQHISGFSTFVDLEGNPIQRKMSADYTVLLYWAIFTGRLNKDHVKIWMQSLEKQTECSINILLVNIDPPVPIDSIEKTIVKTMK